MQEYLPFIIGLGLVLLQFYNNFRKEQEKARKRNPTGPVNGGDPNRGDAARRQDLPRQHPDVSSPGRYTKAGQDRPSTPDLVKESFDPKRPYEPVYERDYREPVYKTPQAREKSVTRPTVTPRRVEIAHLEDISDETMKGRAIHAPHSHRFTNFQEEQEGGSPQFDMEDAIIKQAILNRPEH